MSDVGESRWFKISLFVFSAVVTVVAAFNVWAIYKLRAATNSAGTAGGNAASAIGVSNGETTFLLVANIILLVFAIALLIYSIWKLSVSKKSRQALSNKAYEIVTTDEGGFDIVESPEPVAPVVKAKPTSPAGARVRYAIQPTQPTSPTGARIRLSKPTQTLPVQVVRPTTRSIVVED